MAPRGLFGGGILRPLLITLFVLAIFLAGGCSLIPGSTPATATLPAAPTPSMTPPPPPPPVIQTQVVKETVVVQQTVVVEQTVVVTATQLVPYPVPQTVISTRTYSQTIDVWMANWVRGAINGMGQNPWILADGTPNHRTDEIDPNLVLSGWIGWYIDAGKRPPFDWEWVTLNQMKVWLQVYPNRPEWLMNFVPPPGKELIFFRYPNPPAGMKYLGVVPQFQVDSSGNVLKDGSGQPLSWPLSDDVLRQNKVLVALEPPKPLGFGCGNIKIFFPKPPTTPTPTPTATLPPGPVPPTVPPPPATETPVPPPTETPIKPPTVPQPTRTPTGVVICPVPPCPPVATNTPAARTPTPLPRPSPTQRPVPTNTPPGVVICGTPGNPPCPPVPTNTPAAQSPTALPPVNTPVPTNVPATAVPPTVVGQTPSPPVQPTAVPPTVPPVPPTAVSGGTSTPAPR